MHHSRNYLVYQTQCKSQQCQQQKQREVSSTAGNSHCIFHAIPVGSRLFGNCLIKIEVDQIRPDQPDPHKEAKREFTKRMSFIISSLVILNRSRDGSSCSTCRSSPGNYLDWFQILKPIAIPFAMKWVSSLLRTSSV